jgi:hypothetical protein
MLHSILLLADGLHSVAPQPSRLESALGLLGTFLAVWLFLRAVLRGNGALGRGRSRESADLPTSVPAPLLVLLQIHRHLGGKALSLSIREALKAERAEKLPVEAEVRLAERVVAPRPPKARPTFLIEKR